jgi:hypothetical protein
MALSEARVRRGEEVIEVRVEERVRGEDMVEDDETMKQKRNKTGSWLCARMNLVYTFIPQAVGVASLEYQVKT